MEYMPFHNVTPDFPLRVIVFDMENKNAETRRCGGPRYNCDFQCVVSLRVTSPVLTIGISVDGHDGLPQIHSRLSKLSFQQIEC
jgi:hypothetical protein